MQPHPVVFELEGMISLKTLFINDTPEISPSLVQLIS